MQEMLDLDYGIAKDQYLDLKKAPKSARISTRDRYEEQEREEKRKIEDPANDHLGGSWYEASGPTLANQANDPVKGRHLKFDNYTGRGDGAENDEEGGGERGGDDQLMQEILDDFELNTGRGGNHNAKLGLHLQKEGGALDLDIKNANPSMPENSQLNLLKFPNQKSHPRFPLKGRMRRRKAEEAKGVDAEVGGRAGDEYDDDFEPEEEERGRDGDGDGVAAYGGDDGWYFEEEFETRPEYEVNYDSKHIRKHPKQPHVNMSQQLGRHDQGGSSDGRSENEKQAQEDLEMRVMMRELDLPVDNEDMLADLDSRLALAHERAERVAKVRGCILTLFLSFSLSLFLSYSLTLISPYSLYTLPTTTITTTITTTTTTGPGAHEQEPQGGTSRPSRFQQR